MNTITINQFIILYKYNPVTLDNLTINYNVTRREYWINLSNSFNWYMLKDPINIFNIINNIGINGIIV